MDFYKKEDQDGLRFSWNIFPTSKVETTRLIVPIGCLYTPLKQTKNLPIVKYNPIACKKCRSILSPLSAIDFKKKIWKCPFCKNQNAFTQSYSQINENLLPIELHPTSTTIEYQIEREQPPTPSYLFVIDRTLPKEDFETLKQIMAEKINDLPSDSYIGIISYGKNVWVHELEQNFFPKSKVLQGEKNYTAEQIRSILNLPTTPAVMGSDNKSDQENSQKKSSLGKYLIPLRQERKTILDIILQKLPYTTFINKNQAKTQREPRAIGNAIAIALTLIQSRYGTGRIVMLMGGAATVGRGKIVDLDRSIRIRSHNDLFKGTSSELKNAAQFYDAVAKSAARSGHAIDLFSVCFDQVGLFEMKNLAQFTGGLMTICESFKDDTFLKSFSYLCNQNNFAMDATIELKTSSELKVSSELGNCKI
ncbi:protein transport protein sec23 [Anaeramoeba flamelloides]|uniref:Protein transport protein SEC23 n=1 Tax=Anaeramoeba flamelloides TaxID=1746091 RepID=A0ABQ8Z2Z9_9EUKA|nr:protein transport protein sec23 [Anaeramoeba flamelloides]